MDLSSVPLLLAGTHSVCHPNLCESPKRLCCVPVYHHMGTALIVSTRYDSPYSGIPCRYWLSSLLCDGEIGLPTQKCRCGQRRSSHHNCAPVDTTGWLRVRCRVSFMPKSSWITRRSVVVCQRIDSWGFLRLCSRIGGLGTTSCAAGVAKSHCQWRRARIIVSAPDVCDGTSAAGYLAALPQTRP